MTVQNRPETISYTYDVAMVYDMIDLLQKQSEAFCEQALQAS
jgi:hypothetical protein